MNNLIFDLGKVIIDWNPKYLFRKFTSDEQKIDYFLNNICTSDWNRLIDLDYDPNELCSDLSNKFPEWKEWIWAYNLRYVEQVREYVPGMADLVHRLKAAGKCGMYILSNWNTDYFNAIKDKFPIIQIFDGALYSGKEGMAKPAPEFYHLLLCRYHFDPQSCLFIDDRQENVTAAEAVGMKGFLFTEAKPLEKYLQTLNLL